MRSGTSRHILAIALFFLSIMILGAVLAQSSSYSLTLPSAGCYQAKCTQGLWNQANTAPTSGSSISYTAMHYLQSSGSQAGLGCSSNTSIVACSYTGSDNNVRLFNANGSSIALQAPFNDTASHSAPIVFADGGVLAVDDSQIGYTPPAHNAWFTLPTKAWNNNPFTYPPISPAIVQGNIAFIASGCLAVATTGGPNCGVATFNISSTATLPSYPESAASVGLMSEPSNGQSVAAMQLGGVQYATSNSPGVDTAYNRVYVVAYQYIPNSPMPATNVQPGALIAYDVAADGTIARQVDVFDFPGPSGASPVVIPNFTVGTQTGTAIFFDGTTRTNGSPADSDCLTTTASSSGRTAESSACFYGILDTYHYSGGSASGSVIFKHVYENTTIQAGAGLDPRGGLWIFPSADSGYCSGGSYIPNCLIRIDETSGNPIQGPIEMTATLGLTPSASSYHQPFSAIALSQAVVGTTTHT